jgi:hypothetical protein
LKSKTSEQDCKETYVRNEEKIIGEEGHMENIFKNLSGTSDNDT